LQDQVEAAFRQGTGQHFQPHGRRAFFEFAAGNSENLIRQRCNAAAMAVPDELTKLDILFFQ